MTISLTDIGDRLRKAREGNGHSVKRAASIIGYSETKIRRIERKGTSDLVTIENMCDAYRADIRVVLFGVSPCVDATPPEVQRYIIELGRYYERSSDG